MLILFKCTHKSSAPPPKLREKSNHNTPNLIKVVSPRRSNFK